MESYLPYICDPMIHVPCPSQPLLYPSQPRPPSPSGMRAARKRIVTSALLCLLGLGWYATPSAAEVLSLEQAIALATQNNRLVKNSSLDVEKAVAQTDATKTHRLPSLSFKAQANQLLSPSSSRLRKAPSALFRRPGRFPLRKPNSRRARG